MVAEAIILAAGHGTRMKSELPKVLHPLGGRPMVQWVVQACQEACGRPPHLIVGPDAKDIRALIDDQAVFVEQADRLGTGHAVRQAESALRGKADLVLVTHADLPLLLAETLKRLVTTQAENSGPVTMLTVKSDDPRGFGRVIRDRTGEVTGIVEALEATTEQLALRELNVGAYCFHADWLWDNLLNLRPSDKKGEYYLTDMIAMAAAQGARVAAVETTSAYEEIGINSREHLAQAEAALRERVNRKLMLSGVTLLDPRTTYIEAQVEIGADSIILPNTHILGKTQIGRGAKIGPNAIVRDSTIGDACVVLSSVIEEAILEDDVDIGPFAHLRRGAHLKHGVHMGNFGEVKNSTLEAGVKVGHFSYIGDATVGARANIGAGTITCNYDGERKHKTEIGEDAFIGSDTMLVAPVKVGKRARTGAGSVVTRDVPEDSVAVGAPARVISKKKGKDG